MAGEKVNNEVKRINLIDPNDFTDQYAGNSFSDNKFNMSVPPEDLSIIVELSTYAKGRSILITSTNANTTVANNKINVTFNNNEIINLMTFSDDATTGNKPILTTKYTDLSTQLTTIDEALGLTSIDIDFNSSYTPMVNINFIDVRGGAIFQQGGTSKYSVFFRLPYPLFQLKIKGFYGKPVIYCLHLTKFTSKFNSQTGNFEISTNFVGYTYALLADMIIGYLKAAGETARGQKLLEMRKVMPINTLLQKISQIDDSIKKQLNINNTDATDLSLFQKAENKVNDLITMVLKYASNLQQTYQQKTLLASTIDNKDVIAIDISSGKAVKDELYTNVNAFNTTFQEAVKAYNAATIGTNIGLIPNLGPIFTQINPSQLTVPVDPQVSSGLQKAYARYGITDGSAIQTLVLRLKSAVPTNQSSLLQFVDFKDCLEVLNNQLTEISQQEKKIEQSLGDQLFQSIKSILGFDPNIRNITNIFTTHIEVLLQLIFEVAQKSKSSARVGELSIFKNTDKLDITQADYDTEIFPWPEYQQAGEETYLGKPGVLKNPEQVPEIQLVNDLYDGMIASEKVIQSLDNLNDTGTVSWSSTNPVDSLKYYPIKPYDRLPTSVSPEDLATYVVLRSTAYMGFSNSFLTTDEIKNFAVAEAQQLIAKYQNNLNIINALSTNFKTPENYLNASSALGNPNTTLKSFVLRLLPQNSNAYTYTYIDEGTKNRFVLPTDQNFFGPNAIYKASRTAVEPSKFLLSSRVCNTADLNNVQDLAFYVNIIEKADYEAAGVTSNNGAAANPINVGVLFGKPSGDVSNWLKSGNFNANGGKYGVQEFSTADYSGTGDKTGINGTNPFFSLFYDNSTINATNLSGGRVKNSLAAWDLYDTKGQANKFTISNDPAELYSNQQNRGQNLLFFGKQNDVVSNQFTFGFPFIGFSVNAERTQSLFGSRLYNYQTKAAKAFLFLHALPWRGLVLNPTSIAFKFSEAQVGLFGNDLMQNIFKFRTGFVQVPKLFPAFLGALLWRYEKGGKDKDNNSFSSRVTANGALIKSGSDPIFFTNNAGDSLIYTSGEGRKTPTSAQYCVWRDNDTNGMQFAMKFLGDKDLHVDIEDVITKMPNPAKQVFINEFFDFVNGANGFVNQGFATFQQLFEIYPVTAGAVNIKDSGEDADLGWTAAFSNIKSKEVNGTNNVNTMLTYLSPDPENGETSTNGAGQPVNTFFRANYTVLTYLSNVPNNYTIEYSLSSTISNQLIKLLFDYKYLANCSWKMWGSAFLNSPPNCDATVYVPISNFNTYFNAFNAEIANFKTAKDPQFFNNKNTVEIKHEIYRTLKKIYDKWIANTDNPNKAIFQCCTTGGIFDTPSRLPKDANIAATVPGDTDSKYLINSFRFINRAFEDIGNKLPINPVALSKLLIESSDTSFYDLLSRILTENNMIFIPLPTYIDYSSPKEVQSIFRAYPYYEAADLPVSGPSFVCMYVGQTSTKLDFGGSSQYPNDGMDLNRPSDMPSDMTAPLQDFETPTAAFLVRYGQQNQNIFKDIMLDQAEFTETAESLRITDAIANSFSQTSQSYVGQNLYNVYSVRSYKAEVSMMGNAMIQPMMYFQLDNIPMFRGAYLIIGVKHHITPNNMSTVFTGVRIKKIATPLIDAVTMYTSLLQGYELPVGATPTAPSAGPYKLSTQFAENKKDVKNYFKALGYSKILTAGIMGNMEVESNFKLTATNLNDTNHTSDIGLIQWNSQSYPDVFKLYNAGQFSTVKQQLDHLVKMGTFKTFFQQQASTPNLDEQYAAFLFAHYVEVCCGCANTRGFTTLQQIYGGPYTNGWGCPQNDPKAPRFFPHKRSTAASAILKQFNDSTSEFFWG